VVKAAASGLEGLLDRMKAVKNFHRFSVEDGRSAQLHRFVSAEPLY
jgi:hypothetical protein